MLEPQRPLQVKVTVNVSSICCPRETNKIYHKQTENVTYYWDDVLLAVNVIYWENFVFRGIVLRVFLLCCNFVWATFYNFRKARNGLCPENKFCHRNNPICQCRFYKQITLINTNINSCCILHSRILQAKCGDYLSFCFFWPFSIKMNWATQLDRHFLAHKEGLTSTCFSNDPSFLVAFYGLYWYQVTSELDLFLLFTSHVLISQCLVSGTRSGICYIRIDGVSVKVQSRMWWGFYPIFYLVWNNLAMCTLLDVQQ